MEYMDRRLREIILDHHPWLLYDPTIDMRTPSNHMTSQTYCNKYPDMAEKCQMPSHTDILYRQFLVKINGKGRGKKLWLPCKTNSQKLATPVITLSFLDPRTIYFTEYDPKKKKTVQTLLEKSLGHGTVTFGHPWDEKPKKNTKQYSTQIQHGKIKYGGDDRVSISLSFRSTVAKLFCHEETGHVFVSDEDRAAHPKWKERDEMLKNVESLGLTRHGKPMGCNVKEVESKVQRMYKDARRRWVNTPIN